MIYLVNVSNSYAINGHVDIHAYKVPFKRSFAYVFLFLFSVNGTDLESPHYRP